METYYQNALVFNGKDFEKTDFTVENGVFTHVGPNTALKSGAVDLSNYYVTPGLINCHTHMTSSPDPHYWDARPQNTVTKTVLALENLKEALSFGVTYVRDVGSTDDVDLTLMKLDLPSLPGIVGSGRALSMTGGHGANKNGNPDEGTLECDGEESVRKAARTVLRSGAKTVKLMATGGVSTPGESPLDVQLSEGELRAAIVEAHHKGVPAAAHAQGTEGIKNAVAAGVDSVEHAIYVDDEVVTMLKEKGTYVVPTLVAPRAIYENPGTLPTFMVEKAREVGKEHLNSIRKLVKASVPIAMGTDAGTPFNDFGHWVVNELKMYLDAGMTPEQVLNSATTEAAKLLRVDKYVGAVKQGYEADFVVLKDNPLDDFDAFNNARVYRKGNMVVDHLPA